MFDPTHLQKIVDTYNNDNEGIYELEVSFLTNGMNNNTFITAVNKFKNNTKYNSKSTSLTLDVIMEIKEKGNNSRVRMSINGQDEINKFISSVSSSSDNKIIKLINNVDVTKNPEFTKIEKINVDKLDSEFNCRIRLSTEKDINIIKKATDNSNIKLFYRMKKRLSLVYNTYVIEASVVKQNSRLSMLNESPERYEIECEFMKTSNTISNSSNNIFTHKMINDICMSIFKIITNIDQPLPNLIQANIIQEYNNLNPGKARHPVTLDMDLVANVDMSYAAIDKTDGERSKLFIKSGKGYIIKNSNIVIGANLELENSNSTIIFDGELITYKNRKVYLIFDIYYIDGKSIRDEKLHTRDMVIEKIVEKYFLPVKFEQYISKNNDLDHTKITDYYNSYLPKYYSELQKTLDDYISNSCSTKNVQSCTKLIVMKKNYLIPIGINKNEALMYGNIIWKNRVNNNIYNLDGLVFTPLASHNELSVKKNVKEYKWKPPYLNSIDFYVSYDIKPNVTTNIISPDGINRYIKCYLMVGQTITNNYNNKRGVETPVNFSIDGINQYAYLPILNNDNVPKDREGNEIVNHCVCEFIYRLNDNVDLGYKWVPILVRYDKTEIVQREKRGYGNYKTIAFANWLSIIKPVTEDILLSLANPDTYEIELDNKNQNKNKNESINKNSYYQKKTNLGSGMRAFNNFAGKLLPIKKYMTGMENVVDLNCGRLGDGHKYANSGIKRVLGIDIDEGSLFKIEDSAIKRANNIMKKNNNIRFNFIQHDLTKLLVENNNIKNIEQYEKSFDGINCQFGIHYYLKDEESFNNFLQNVNFLLKDGGYMIVTCFDGDILSDKLEGVNNYSQTYIVDGVQYTLFDIEKKYIDKIGTNNIGKAIDFYNSMISNDNVYNREYLVHPEFLIDSFDKKCNMDIIETDLFYNVFKIFQEYISLSNGLSNFVTEGVKINELIEFYKNYNKTDSSDAASFELMALNRYYVFRKRVSTDKTVGEKSIRGGSSSKSNDNKHYDNYETITGMLNNSISNKLSQLVQLNNNALIDKRTTYSSVNDIITSNAELLNKHPRIIILYNTDHINKNDPKIIDKIKYVDTSDNNKVGKELLLVYRQKKNTYFPVMNKVTKDMIWTSTKSTSNINNILKQINN